LKAGHIAWYSSFICKEQRQKLMGHRSYVLWLTGLSASGKSTLANALECYFYKIGIHTYWLDGDNIRHGLNRDLGFSPHDRKENIRRIAEVAKLFVDAGIVVITSFISPYRADRLMARELVEKGEFVEIYVKAPLYECEKRDPKGLYRKARRSEISNFTGISAPYEEPLNPEIIIETHKLSVEESVDKVISFLNENGLL